MFSQFRSQSDKTRVLAGIQLISGILSIIIEIIKVALIRFTPSQQFIVIHSGLRHLGGLQPLHHGGGHLLRPPAGADQPPGAGDQGQGPSEAGSGDPGSGLNSCRLAHIPLRVQTGW